MSAKLPGNAAFHRDCLLCGLVVPLGLSTPAKLPTRPKYTRSSRPECYSGGVMVFAPRIKFSLVALLLVLVAGWSAAVHARMAPKQGRFLVGANVQPGLFSHSVVLLIAYGSDGAMGLIINRPTKHALAEALPDMSALQDRKDTLYLGGPVGLDRLTLLIHSQTPPSDAVHVAGDIYASGSLKTLRTILQKHARDAQFRGYAGYAGWEPGQLEREIAHGEWKVLPANADEVFTTEPGDLWNKLSQQPDLQMVRAHLPGSMRSSAEALRVFPSTRSLRRRK